MVQTLPVLFFLLGGCGLMPSVNGFTEEELKLITDYVQTTYEIDKPHAYVIKFEVTECANMNEETIRNALKKDKVNVVRNTINRGQIYEGRRMVMAAHKDDPMEYAEDQLLYPDYEKGFSPVEKLRKKTPSVACAIFFTLYSPYEGFCIDPNVSYNIVQKLNQFCCIDERAFVYKQTHSQSDIPCRLRDRVQSINGKMPVYRCQSNCIECIINGVFNNNCG